VPVVAAGAWFPEQIVGDLVVLRRHGPGNLPAFRRWYGDPEVARLARYQDAPMRVDEIDRFFQARAMGPDALAMAIHVRATDRLIGSCAFSQVDGDNGSATYHITIGEKDAWGHGYGTEATALMVDHAFRVLGLHRVSLAVFEFNERAIRAYRRCGFVAEGRARQAIWRDGRWWDEIAMSILASEWRALPIPAGRSIRTGRPARARLIVEGTPSDAAGPGARPGARPGADDRPAARPAAGPAARPGARPGADDRPAARPAAGPGARPGAYDRPAHEAPDPGPPATAALEARPH
jgi:RimJ/RimL family protein N-acetyltransferase